MDEKGASTLPFYNLPPEVKKTPLKVFPVLFHLSFWIKEKSVETLAKPQHLQKQTQNLKSVLPPYHRTGDSTGDLILKSGVTLGLDYIYLLTLFDLFALHFGSLFGFVLNLTPGFGDTF